MKPDRALPSFGMQDGDTLWQWICSVPEAKQLMLPEGPGARGSRWGKTSSSLCHSFQRTDRDASAASCVLKAAGALPLSQTRSARRRDVTIAIGIRFHNFILVMGVLQASLLDGGRVVIETPSPAPLPSLLLPPAPRTTSSWPHLSIPSPPWLFSEESQSHPWAILYLSQLAGLGD